MAAKPDEFELLIDRAAQAMRELIVPDGPPVDIVENVRLKAVAATRQDFEPLERTKPSFDASFSSSSGNSTSPLMGVKVVRLRNLVVIAAGLLLLLATQLLPIQRNGNFAFAQVQEQVRQTKSVQYVETPLGFPSTDGHPTVIAHVKILGNRIMRNELHAELKDGKHDNSFLGPWGRSIEIIDLDKKKKATLYPEVRGYMSMDWGGTFAGVYTTSPKEQKAIEEKVAAARKEQGAKGDATKTGTYVAGAIDWKSAKPYRQLDIYELISHVPTDQAKKLGEKTVNGKRAIGFLIEEEEKYGESVMKWRHTWWVDPTTKLPLQLEISWGDDASKESGSKVVSDIVFDAPLDPAMFSIDVPSGYTDLGPEARKAAELGQAIASNPNRMNTVQFTEVENMKSKDGQAVPELVKRVMILDNYLKREEVALQPADKTTGASSAGIVPHISVQDAKQKKTIVLLAEKKEFLDPAKTAFIPDYLELTERQMQQAKDADKINVYAELTFPEKESSRLPLKEVDGQLAFGKHVEKKVQRGKYEDSRSWTFWVDPFSRHVIRGEGTLRSTDPSIGEVEYVLRDFKFYAPVDKTLFRIDPPEGWIDWTQKRAVKDEPSPLPGKPIE